MPVSFCSVEIKFNIGKANIDDAKANVIKVQPYKGKAVTPKVSLKLGSYKLKEGVDYTVEYENNDSRGRARRESPLADSLFMQ